jgi:PAS domain S-box-containing protein
VPAPDNRVGSWGRSAPLTVEWGLLCSIDSRRYFTALGEGWEDALGWTREELLSRPFTDFVHPAEREGTLASMAAAWQRDSAAIALDTRFRMRGGRWQRVRWSPSPDRAELAATAGAVPAGGRSTWRRRLLAGAALRAGMSVALICAAIGVGLLLTSFAHQDTSAPEPSLAEEAPFGIHGPVSSLGPTLGTSSPGLVGAPLSRRGAIAP